MIYSTEGTHIHAFRERTEKNVAMLSAGHVPAKAYCHRCETRRTAATGRYTASGKFVCHGCGKK